MPAEFEQLLLHLNVAPEYVHVAKHVAGGVPVQAPNRLLKWYEVHPMERPVPAAISALARQPLASGAIAVDGLGFVVLHRCGSDFYFLIVATWRNENELWETVWYKNGEGMAEFALFERQPPHLPTYCVWELVPLWHEQGAWVRFLRSARAEADIERWVADQYQGAA